jgi:ubiquitin-protein ligase
MTPRLRRLHADHQRVLAAFGAHPRIRLLAAEGAPPEKYTFEYFVTGLVPAAGDTHSLGTSHRAQIFLPLDYPRRAPFCRMITPVFHPNIDPQKICLGDHWSAGQTLDALVVRIAEMICYQSYNTRSPLNARAAAWAESHVAELPLEAVDLSSAG